MPPVGFEPVIPTSERQQFHPPDRAATGIDNSDEDNVKKICLPYFCNILTVQISSLNMGLEISGKRKRSLHTDWYIA
jgi:hypothetical protein